MITWKANYNDGSHLEQYNADGSENKYADIDRLKLLTFTLVNSEKTVFSLSLHEGQRLIFRRRKWINLVGVLLRTVYLVGYQFNDSTGKNYKVISYVHEDGLVELDDDRSDLVVVPEEQ